MKHTNQRFACYAIEHFDGAPTDYDVCFYDGQEIPPINLENPSISIDIHLEGKLSNPFDRAQLCDWCDDHGLELVDDCEEGYPFSDYHEPELPPENIYTEFVEPDQDDLQFAFMNEDEDKYDESEVATEDFQAATEGPIAWINDKLKARSTVKTGLAYDSKYDANVKNLQNFEATGECTQAPISDAEVADYYASDYYDVILKQFKNGINNENVDSLINEKGKSLTTSLSYDKILYVYFGTDKQVFGEAVGSVKGLNNVVSLALNLALCEGKITKEGAGSDKAKEAEAKQKKYKDDIASTFQKFESQVVRQIRLIVGKQKEARIFGYLVDTVEECTSFLKSLQAVLSKPKEDRADGATKKADAREVEPGDNLKTLDREWKTYGTNQRKATLDAYVRKGGIDLDEEVYKLFLKTDAPWSTILGRIFLWVYRSKDKTKKSISADVIKTIVDGRNSKELTKLLTLDENMMLGLDFGNINQWEVIRIAIELDRRAGQTPISYLEKLANNKKTATKMIRDFVDAGKEFDSFTDLLYDSKYGWSSAKEMDSIMNGVLQPVYSLIESGYGASRSRRRDSEGGSGGETKPADVVNAITAIAPLLDKRKSEDEKKAWIEDMRSKLKGADLASFNALVKSLGISV